EARAGTGCLRSSLQPSTRCRYRPRTCGPITQHLPELKEIVFDNLGGGADFIGRLSHINRSPMSSPLQTATMTILASGNAALIYLAPSPSVCLILMSTRAQSGRRAG